MLKFLEKLRINQCLKYCQGRILDIGCGYNNLVKKYGNGLGVDVYPWPGVDLVCQTTNLPLPDESFDRAFMIASLNHIPQADRPKVLQEAKRALKSKGLLVLTMIGPKIGFCWHKIGRLLWDKDQKERGMKQGEAFGLSKKQMLKLLKGAGFINVKIKNFELGLNKIYAAQKP